MLPWVTRLATPGIEISKRLIPFSSSGQANSTSGAGFEESQCASIAASLAGWYLAVSSPWRWPISACSGAVSAIIRIAMRTIVRADSVLWPTSRWRAPVASTTKAVVR